MSRRVGSAIAMGAAMVSTAWAETAPVALDFVSLEAAGARIGEIHIRANDIFDLSDTREDNWLFRLANRLHFKTRPDVIKRALLFKSGDPVSAKLIEETERLLRDSRYLYDVQLRPVSVHEGVVDIEVVTRDTWSLDVAGTASREGGANAGGIRLAEHNLFGTGATLAWKRVKDVDRTRSTFSLRNDRAFGTWTDLSYSQTVNSDGRSKTFSAIRPFYAMDTRWAAGVTASQDDRIDSVYRGGVIQSQYRHQLSRGDAFAGWSRGVQEGWVNRYSLGVLVQDDAYLPEPGLAAPATLPTDRKLRAPFARWELVEDRFDRELNRNLIGRPEYFLIGLNATVQLGRALGAMGSSDNAWLYTAGISRGFEPQPGDTLMVAARLNGQYHDGEIQRQRFGVQAQYYAPRGPKSLFYAAGLLETLTRPEPVDALMLGGEEGLRGYPLRYQSGTRRVLMTVEQRFFTDLFVWRLFRLGGAAYVDVGRAWGGDMASPGNTGWLSNVGAGLRIVNARSAFSNVVHVDVAVPLQGGAEVKRVQLLIRTKTSF